MLVLKKTKNCDCVFFNNTLCVSLTTEVIYFIHQAASLQEMLQVKSHYIPESFILAPC